ncbi:MAG: hypothetical protein V4594_04625 [Bacteroidota bacterium]
MRRKINESYLLRLNRKAAFVQFKDTTWCNENTDSAEAEYFSEVVSLSFPNASKQRPDDEECYTTFWLRLYGTDEKGCYQQMEYEPFERELDTLSQVIELVNTYVRSRLFRIIWQQHGKYLLLDPNGLNYTGELISLTDAKRTCQFNFLLNPKT